MRCMDLMTRQRIKMIAFHLMMQFSLRKRVIVLSDNSQKILGKILCLFIIENEKSVSNNTLSNTNQTTT